MIDFYKFCYLSVLGKKAGEMTDNEYTKEIIEKYDVYLNKTKELKKQTENKN